MSEDNDSSSDEETTEDQNGNQKKKTILYAMTREALREEDLIALKNALPEGYSLKPSEDGENIMFQREETEGSSIDVNSILNQ